MPALLIDIQSWPREILLSAGCAALIFLLAIVLLVVLRRKKKASDIGLRRVETNFSESPFDDERREPEGDFRDEEAFDPLENAATPPNGTRVFERVFEPVTHNAEATHVVRETVRPAPVDTRRAEPVMQESAPDIATEPQSETDEPPSFYREEAPWTFLETLPFRMRPGLRTMHADMVGIGVEAVFFDPESVNRLSDPVTRLVPFLPDGDLLLRESDRKTFLMGSLHAQPDAVIETAAGLLSVEYKSKSGRSDDPADLRRTIRTKDLLQTLIEAMVLSSAARRPVAPILRTHNAVYFLRPERRIMTLLSESIVRAEDFISPYSTQKGISASDYAALCAVAAERLFASPVTDRNLAGEAAHKRMLG